MLKGYKNTNYDQIESKDLKKCENENKKITI